MTVPSQSPESAPIPSERTTCDVCTMPDLCKRAHLCGEYGYELPPLPASSRSGEAGRGTETPQAPAANPAGSPETPEAGRGEPEAYNDPATLPEAVVIRRALHAYEVIDDATYNRAVAWLNERIQTPSLPEGDDGEPLLRAIEAAIRAVHHNASVADHPAMKDRVDSDVAGILDDVRAYAAARLTEQDEWEAVARTNFRDLQAANDENASLRARLTELEGERKDWRWAKETNGHLSREKNELTSRVRTWAANLADALGESYPTAEETIGAAIAAIHRAKAAARDGEALEKIHRALTTNEDGWTLDYLQGFVKSVLTSRAEGGGA